MINIFVNQSAWLDYSSSGQIKNTCKKGETLVPNLRIILRLATQSMQPMHQPINMRLSRSSVNSVQAGTSNMVKGRPNIPINISTWTGTNLQETLVWID